MPVDHPLIALDIAISRQDDVLHHAAVARLARHARGARPSLADRLRRSSGVALIRLGQSLQRRHPHAELGDLAAARVMRIAR